MFISTMPLPLGLLYIAMVGCIRAKGDGVRPILLGNQSLEEERRSAILFIVTKRQQFHYNMRNTGNAATPTS
jgi:hypothetical protein